MTLPYLSSKTEVEAIFDKIKSLELSDATKNYYNEKFETKEQWCMAYKKDLPCLRIGTTSRIEGINAIVKTELNASSRLVELLLRMLQIHEHILNTNYSDSSAVSNLLLENLKENSILKAVKNNVSDFVYNQIALSISKSFDLSVKLYKGKYTITGKGDFKVEINKEDPKCSCKYFQTMGIPCSHLISIVFKNKDISIFKFIKERWIKESDNEAVFDSHLTDKIKEFLLQKDQLDNQQHIDDQNKEEEEKSNVPISKEKEMDESLVHIRLNHGFLFISLYLLFLEPINLNLNHEDIQNPNICVVKGRPSNKRPIGAIEKASLKRKNENSIRNANLKMRKHSI